MLGLVFGLNGIAALPLLHESAVNFENIDGNTNVSPGTADCDDLFAFQQPRTHPPITTDELRLLEWGDLNFLHTTDTHGWLAGHLLESEFSADWGDFVSFSERMRANAKRRGVDLLIIDSGDRHDGNGLSDASKHDGSLSLPIFGEIDYDLVTVGNHELYRGSASLQEFHDIRKRFGERYVVSNVEVAVGSAWVPMGNKYRVFTTPHQKIRVLGLGFLFDFTRNDKSATRVTPVAEELQKPWFETVLRDVLPQIDHVVVAAHIPARNSPEIDQILRKIRQYNATIPVSMFGGHSHVRDYRKLDDYAACLQSGRYVETLGWASVNQTLEKPNFSRSYIDFNTYAMAFHAQDGGSSGVNVAKPSFATDHGLQVSQQIAKSRKKLDLDHHYADVPATYYTDRAPYPSNTSIYSLLVEHVLPLLTSPVEVANTTRYIFFNTGGIRFDLFRGPFTKDTGYIVSPYANQWFYIANVPQNVADQILPLLNRESSVLNVKSAVRSDQSFAFVSSARGSEGYVTNDDLGDDGDDTVHTPWKFYPIPNCVQSTSLSATSSSANDEGLVTLVFHDFLAWYIQRALHQLKRDELFDPILHNGEHVTELIIKYLRKHEPAV